MLQNRKWIVVRLIITWWSAPATDFAILRPRIKSRKTKRSYFSPQQRIQVTFPNPFACICSRTFASRNTLLFLYQVIKPCLSKVIDFEIGQLERSQCRFPIQTFTICGNVTHRLIERRPRSKKKRQDRRWAGQSGSLLLWWKYQMQESR